MNHQAARLLYAILFIFVAATSSSSQSRQDVAGFVAAAGDAGREMALLTPAVQKVHEAAAYLPLIGTARKLAAKVQQTGTAMTPAQYENLQRELEKIETDLEKLLGAPGGKCPKSCRVAFGDGYAGSTGWNRFVCKLGCIKIKPLPEKPGG